MGIFHQERYLGERKRKNYFEGFYFRCVSKEGKTFAAIPGISKSDNDSHSFIQIIDCNNSSFYHRYPAETFEYSKNTLFFNVGSSSFSQQGMKIEIAGENPVLGKILFEDPKKLSKSLFAPSIMGPFSYVPLLECRHEVIFVSCTLSGKMKIGKETVDFDGGKGYVEKDFGSSFPSDYLWIETNTFENSDASFMLSAAVVPFAGRKMRGLISFLYDGEKTYRFATYTGDRIRTLYSCKNKIEIEISSQSKTLHITAVQFKTGALKAPQKGEMNREIRECLGGTAEIELFNMDKQVFSGKGICAGIEICGNTFNL